MAVAATLRAVLGLDTAEFDKGLKRAGDNAGRFETKMNSVAQGIGQGFGQQIYRVFERIVGAANRAVQSADQMGKFAQKVNIGVEALSKLEYAARMADVGRGQLQTGLSQLNKKITEAAGGNEKLAGLFQKVGVSIFDAGGKVRPTAEVFADLAERFSSFEDGPQKAAAAMAIFGKAGANLLPLLNEGKEGLRLFGEEAESLGLVISKKTAKEADRFGDSIDRLRLIGEGFVNKVLARLLPFLNQFADLLVDDAKSAAQANTGVEALVTGITALVNGVSIAVSVVGLLVEGFKAVAQILPGIGSAIGTSVSAGFEQLSNFALAAIEDTYSYTDAIADNQKVWDEAEKKVGKNWESIKDAAFDGSAAVQKALAGVQLKVSDLFDGGGSAGAMEFGREITKTNAPVIALGAAADDSAKKLDKLIDKFDRLGADAELTNARAAELGAGLQLAFSSGNVIQAGKIVKIIEQLADRTNKLVQQRSLEKFRKQVDQLIDRVTQLNIDPIAADMLALNIALEDAFSRDDLQSVEKITAAIEEFGKQSEKARLEAEGFRDIGDIAKAAAEDFRNIWTDVFDDLGRQIADFIGSGGEGGVGGLITGLADTLRAGNSRTLNSAISAGFETRQSGGTFSESVGAFSEGGGFDALANIAGTQIGAAAGGMGAGAQAGAAIGTAIGSYYGGPIGGAIGGILGGLIGGAFDSESEPELRVGSRPNIGRVEGQGYGPLGYVFTSTTDYDTPGQEVADSIISFDRTVADLLSPEQLDRAAGALANFFRIYENGSTSLETVLSERFNIIVSTLDARVQAFVGVTGTLEDRVTRLQEALGLLERAEDGLFDNMLGSALENSFGAMNDAQEDAATALDAIGLSAATTREELEAAFNHGEGLTLEQIKLWIEAADSLNELNTATEAYVAAVEAQRMAVQSYNDFIQGFREEALGLSEFQRGLRGLARATRDAVDRANALARAVGLQGAREEDLAQIHTAAAHRAAQAARELENASRSLAEELYGGLNGISSSAFNAASSLNNAADAIERARQGLTDFADDLLIGDDSPLKGRDKLAKAMELLLDASRRGDTSRVEQLATATLGIGRDVFASGRDFNDLFNRIQEIIRGTVPNVDEGGAGSYNGAGDFAASANVLSAAQRYDLAAQLAQNIADLSDFSGDSFQEVAERLGVNLSNLAADLQIAPTAIDAFLTSLQPPAEADAEILPPEFGQITEAIETGTDEVVEAVDDVVEATEGTTDAVERVAEEVAGLRDSFDRFFQINWPRDPRSGRPQPK